MEFFKMDLSNLPPVKIKVIHGETKFFKLFPSVDHLAKWAEKEKTFVMFFATNVDKMPSFKDCSSYYVLTPLFIGNHTKEDQSSIINQCMKQFPEYELI